MFVKFASRWFIPAAVVVLLGLSAQQSRADQISFDLTVGNPAISGFTGPYANVVVNRTSTTTATITMSSYTVGGNIYLFGDGGTIGLNVNSSNFTLSSILARMSAGQISSPGPWYRLIPDRKMGLVLLMPRSTVLMASLIPSIRSP